MDFSIQSELPGRMRVRLMGPVPEADVTPLEQVVRACPAVEKVTVYPRIGSLAVAFAPAARERVIECLLAVDAASIEAARGGVSSELAPRTRSLKLDIAWIVGSFFMRKWFLPKPVRVLLAVWHYRTFLAAGLRSLLAGRLDVPVLDAAAVGISFVKRDVSTAGETMFLLDLGEALEEYTVARSRADLVGSLLAVPETALRLEDDQEVPVPSDRLVPGDLIAVRTGMSVCADGTVERGLAMVNQAVLTGESLAVERAAGDGVFAGTVVEDGEIVVRVRAVAGSTRLRSIVSLVEQSEALKAGVQTRRERLANGIVPWNFLLAGVVALTTRSLVKTSAALMVDYSCALKLTGSISVLSAMSQSVQEGFMVKGSKYFEAVAQADTIVFDKTGTLTDAVPEVAKVHAFDGWNRTQVLRFAACLEEHFPHPVARAVVRCAAAKNLKHRERHAKVEYIVAHGIASSLEGKRCVIGSEHFVVEDEGVAIAPEDRALIAEEFDGLSPLYLAVDGKLVGVIGVNDPLKPGVPEAIEALRGLGFSRIVMLTGDSEKAAAPIAAQAGVDEFRANMLPEQKHAFIEGLRRDGRRVVMVGDGVNDSPALSLADVGVAMGTGTAVAREVADITLSEGDLMSIVRLRRLSCELMRRMDRQFAQVMTLNSILLALGVLGVVTPQTSSLLHNASTVAFSLGSTKKYLKD